MLLVCSGGSCSGDLMKSQAINFSTSTALLTLSFASNQIVLKRRAVSTDAGATYSTLFASPTEAPGAHFTCFTGTKKYFFFSTNTHAEGALQSRTSRWWMLTSRAQTASGPLILSTTGVARM
jgi:hypothetical protein